MVPQVSTCIIKGRRTAKGRTYRGAVGSLESSKSGSSQRSLRTSWGSQHTDSTTVKPVILLLLRTKWSWQCKGTIWASGDKLLRAGLLPIEVGCRGFLGHSLHIALDALGITGGAEPSRNITEVAKKASRQLWIWGKMWVWTSKCYIKK